MIISCSACGKVFVEHLPIELCYKIEIDEDGFATSDTSKIFCNSHCADNYRKPEKAYD